MFLLFADDTTLVFATINQVQLEETINRFGRVIVSTSRCESVLRIWH